LDPISVISGLLGGEVLGVVIGHRLRLRRERRDRRNEFRGFLAAWLNGIRREKDVWKCYGPDNLEHLNRYYGKICKDFFRKRKFKAMCDDLGAIKEKDIKQDQESHRKTIERKIETLIEFV
jgi:hypothetical protein